MDSLFESIKSSFKSIDESISLAKSLKLDQYRNAELMVGELLSELRVENRVNGQREELLKCLSEKIRTDLKQLNSSNLIRFRPSILSRVLSNLQVSLSRFLIYKNSFSIHKKITYMHLIPSPRRYVDFDLFDIKYPHSSIVFSSIISANRIFLLIKLSGNYILHVHQIDRSSFATCKQVYKRSLMKYNFAFLGSRIVAFFDYRYVELYDSNLNLLKQIDFITNERSLLIYKQILTNGSEIIVDTDKFYKIYDRELIEIQQIGQTEDPDAPFFIDINFHLAGISKEFIVYLTAKRDFIRLVSRTSGKAPFSMAHIIQLPNPDCYLSLSYFIDYSSSLVYFKSDDSSLLYCIDLKGINSSTTPNSEQHKQIQVTLEGFQFNVLFDKEANFNEQTILIFKRQIEYFRNSQEKLKLVYIF